MNLSMQNRKIESVGVIGSGTMGSGIAQVFAQHGYRVRMTDIRQDLLDRGLETIRRSLDRFVQKGNLTPAGHDEALRNISASVGLEGLQACDLVVEAVFEDLKAKSSVFRVLDGVCEPRAIFASNTSSISITRLASTTGRPAQFIGMHFMNPVPIMQLVEIIRGQETSDDTCVAAMDVARGLGKTAVEVQDYPGFVSNRILIPMINEAVFALMEGVASRESIDTVMRLGMNHPMGPLTLADFIGLDVCLNILRVLHEGLGDPKYRPCPLLVRMVDAGLLGRKSGRGFYDYRGPEGKS
jgi:3-hydroxybutyryl-CoA dehydrogenase